MHDIIDILNRDGSPTGTSAPKTEIHTKGHYHHTGHLWLYTSEGKILLQQRSSKKLICPLLWDVSVAGHIDAGESIEEGLIREASEEIGLTLIENDLKKIGVFECFQSYPNGIIDNEFHNTYIAKLLVTINDLIPQKEEVEALKLISIEEFRDKLKNSETNNHFVASNRNYYETVLTAIEAQLN